MKKSVALELVLDAAENWRQHFTSVIIPTPMSPEELLHAQGYADDVEKAILTLER